MIVFYFCLKLLVILLLAPKQFAENINCIKYDFDWYIRRGMNTNYDDVRGYGNLTLESCKPLSIWGMFRHGMRSGKNDTIIRINNILTPLKYEIINAYNNGTGTFCKEDIDKFTKWNYDYLMQYESTQLINMGRKQSYVLGERIRNHFPELLNISYDPNLFYFGHSNYQRTLATLRSFVEGFFKNDANLISAYIGQESDVAMYSCNIERVDQFEVNYEGVPELYDYAMKTKLFETISQSISNRTGLHIGNFDKLTIVALYDACTLESGRDHKISPWCNVFSRHDLEKLRLREDIFHYVNFAYGNIYSEDIGCLQMKSLISSLEKSAKMQSDSYILTAMFTHDAVIDALFTRMGCFRSKLDQNYYRSKFSWDISTHTPVNANLLAVLYNCENSIDYKLQFYLNEKPLGCCFANNTEACSWNQFRNRMNEFVLNCQKDFCDKDVAVKSTVQNYIVLFSLMCVVLCAHGNIL